mgnify:CR=1 FL=1
MEVIRKITTNQCYITNQNNESLILGTNGIDRFIINNNGRIGIGANNNITDGLYILGDLNINGRLIYTTSIIDPQANDVVNVALFNKLLLA